MSACTYCGGIGTVGGSFPGTFERYVPGETCPLCNGSGEENRYNHAELPAYSDPIGTTQDWFADGHIEKRTA